MKQQKIKQLWMGEMREEKLIESNNSVKGVEGLDIPLMIVQILLYAPDVTNVFLDARRFLGGDSSPSA